MWRGAMAVAAALLLSACATAAPAPVNVAARAPLSTDVPTQGARDVLFVALSGGGARAAALSLGVLQQMRDTPDADGAPLTDHIALMSAVSGGSVIAGYYGLHGPEGLDDFRTAYLDKDWDSELHMSFVWPPNWVRALNGGMNGPEGLSDWLDAEIFSGADVADFSAHPQIWLNATDTLNGVTFSFTPLYFNVICAELGSVRVADAVAASMAFPLMFRPILVESHAGDCAAPPAWASLADDRNASARARATARAFASYRVEPPLRWLHLSDGGVIDNLGLSSLTLMREIAPGAASPLSERDAARLRRLTLIVVNAEGARSTSWRNEVGGPSGTQVMTAVSENYITLGNQASYDEFRTALAHWQDDLVAWRCSLSAAERAAYAGDIADWSCADVTLTADMISFLDLDAETQARVASLPTRTYLPPEDVDALIAAGREGARRNAALAAFAQP